jgi:DNA-binding transcriptional LysR family regulator
MLLGQLQAFVEVARTGSLSSAADALNLSQSTLSVRLHALEKELGQTLFVRTGRGVRPTDAGRQFQPFAERSLRSVDEGRDALADLRSARAGRLTLGAAPVVSTYVLPSVLKRFASLHPRVEVAVRTGHSEQVAAMVLEDKVQLGLARAVNHPDLDAIPLYEDELVLVCPPRDRLARAGAVRLADLSQERLIMFDPASTYFELTHTLVMRGGVTARALIEVDNAEAAKKLVEEGLGVALLPEVAVRRDISTGLLAQVDIADAPSIRRGVEAIRRKDAGPAGGVLEAFVHQLRLALCADRSWRRSQNAA